MSNRIIFYGSLNVRWIFQVQIARGGRSRCNRLFIKGIGSKTAQRLIVELKDKLSKDFIPGEKMTDGYNTKRDEALSGLIILGFSKIVAEKALNKVIEKEGSTLPVEQLIRHALKIL